MTEGVRWRVGWIVAVVVVVLSVGYWVAESHLVFGPTIYVRNETTSPAYVSLSGYHGDGEDMMTVPPWGSGMCSTATWTWRHHGNPATADNETAALQAGPGSTTQSITVPFADGEPLYVRIDSAGDVRTGEPVPTDTPGCAPYTVRAGWSWSWDDDPPPGAQ